MPSYYNKRSGSRAGGEDDRANERRDEALAFQYRLLGLAGRVTVRWWLLVVDQFLRQLRTGRSRSKRSNREGE